MLRSMEFLLRKLPLSSVIHFMLIFMTRTIRLMSIGSYYGAIDEWTFAIVFYTERDDVVRLISAREVTPLKEELMKKG